MIALKPQTTCSDLIILSFLSELAVSALPLLTVFWVAFHVLLKLFADTLQTSFDDELQVYVEVIDISFVLVLVVIFIHFEAIFVADVVLQEHFPFHVNLVQDFMFL